MKVAWSIGHYPSSKGAYSSILNGWEHDLAKQVVEKGVSMLRNSSEIICYTPVPQHLNKKIEQINAYGADIAIESHFNSSSNESARGCETLYFSIPGVGGIRFSENGKKFAELVQKNTVEVMRDVFKLTGLIYKDRGIVGMADIRRIYDGKEIMPRYAFLTKTKMPAVILEPLFLSNYGDCGFFLKDFDKTISSLATAVVKSILEYNKLTR